MIRNSHLVAAAIALPAAVAAGEPPRYRMYDMSEAFGWDSIVNSINNHGQVAGRLADGRPAIWSVESGLQPMPAFAPAGYNPGISPSAINDHGQIVFDMLHFQTSTEKTFLYDPQTGYSQIPQVGQYQSFQRDINNHGIVLAAYDIGIPYLTWNTRTNEITGMPFLFEAVIGDNGMAGYTGSESEILTASSRTTMDRTSDHRIGHVYDINAHNMVVGRVGDNSGSLGLVWNAQGQLIHEVSLPRTGAFTSINDHGVVLGSYEHDAPSRAFLWTPEWGIRHLDELVENWNGRRFWSSYQINNRGQLLVGGFDDTGTESRMYLLSPVPEPATLVALGLGSLVLLRRRRQPGP